MSKATPNRNSCSQQEEGTPLALLEQTENLPSENDRLHFLGCLVAVLTSTDTYEEKDVTSVEGACEKNINGEDKTLDEINLKQDREVAVGKESDLQNSTATIAGQTKSKQNDSVLERYRIRRHEFQHDLIALVTTLLFLDESHSVTYSRTLDLLSSSDHDYKMNMVHSYIQALSSDKAGFQCVSLLLFRYLIFTSNGIAAVQQEVKGGGHHARIIGYDARVRRTFKILAVAVFVHFEITTTNEDTSRKTSEEKDNEKAIPNVEYVSMLKFEALESRISTKLLAFAEEVDDQIVPEKKKRTQKENIIRGLKIGTAGVVAGTLFAVTGGLAAPGIAAGLATIIGSTAATTAAVVTLTSTAAVTTIFGVGGGGLVASKMKNRTDGLTEFVIRKDDTTRDDKNNSAELSRTVCVSGWVRDKHGFERPWGIIPHNLTNRKELLERFCSVYDPEKFPLCKGVLVKWKGKENLLWKALETKYGRDPDSLLPLEGPRQAATLSEIEEDLLHHLMEDLGYSLPKDHTFSSHKKQSFQQKQQALELERQVNQVPLGKVLSGNATNASEQLPLKESKEDLLWPLKPLLPSDFAKTGGDADSSKAENDASNTVSLVWDYHAKYGGELYTVQWETELLLKIHNTTKDFAKDLAQNATKEVLKHTAFVTLLSAVALPAMFLSVANSIDGNWTLAQERADEAGVELARSLLQSKAGNRPVTLVGYSMGARVIYSCLNELAKHQEKWEDQHQTTNASSSPSKKSRGWMSKNIGGSAWNKSKGKSSSPKGNLNGNEQNNEPGETVVVSDDISFSRQPASIVEDAIIIGCPTYLDLTKWKSCRQIVAGRLINCYCPNDLMLLLMFRYKNVTGMARKPCGTSKVNVVGVENFDVSSMVDWHSEYGLVMREILKFVRFGQPNFLTGMQNSRRTEKEAILQKGTTTETAHEND